MHTHCIVYGIVYNTVCVYMYMYMSLIHVIISDWTYVEVLIFLHQPAELSYDGLSSAFNLIQLILELEIELGAAHTCTCIKREGGGALFRD